MRAYALLIPSLLVAVAAAALSTSEAPAEPAPNAVVDASEENRSPVALALSPDGRYVATANRTADSVTLLDAGSLRPLGETRCGARPVDVAWLDDGRLLVALRDDDAVALLRRENGELQPVWTLPVGDEPRSLAVDGSTRRPRAFVAVSGADELAVVDVAKRRVDGRIPLQAMPRAVALSPDGKWVVTSCQLPGVVTVHDAQSLERLGRQVVFDNAYAMQRAVFLPDGVNCIVPSPVNRTFNVTEGNIRRGWVVDNRLTRLELPNGGLAAQEQLGLDFRGDAVGDLEAVALSPNGRWLAVSAGGTHELVLLDRPRLKWPSADPGDEFPIEMRDDPTLYRRIDVGGRPMGLAFLNDRRLLVANDFANAVQLVDVEDGRLLKTVSLGGPEEPSLARRGEMIFHDAERSFDSWFSCHTCHPDGHTSGQTFDTVNDGNYDTYKLVPTLRGVTRTKPWTWHGWQTSLGAAMRKSLRDTLSTEHAISDDDVRALLAYLRTLEHPPSPHRRDDGSLTDAARRGRALFREKAGCITCHAGRDFTSAETYRVGLENDRMFYDGFNPPTLRGLHARRRFLHDGRAESLEQVLTRFHQPERLAGEPLSDAELDDLIAYLDSL